MKIILTGSTGQLGQEIIKTKPHNIELITPKRDLLDLTNNQQCINFILKEKPDWVFNCAAYTSVDNAEKEIKLSKQVNSYAPQAIAEAVNKTNSNLLHISTDFVFNGEQNFPYLEEQTKSPINQYGYTKALGEDLITNTIKNRNKAIILRTSWILSSVGKNFVLTILNLHSKKDYLNVVSDQIGAPTSVKGLAKVCWKILNVKKEKNLPFIMHWRDAGIASWYDLAFAISDIGFELDILKNKKNINPIKTINYPTPAKRPKYSLLDTQKTSEILGIIPNHWRVNLKDILNEYKTINNFKK